MNPLPDKKHKPLWLKKKLPQTKNYARIKEIVKQNCLHTICTSGNCPNIGECWDAGTATFMVLGDICTRSCKFCSVKTGKPLPADPQEPERIALSVKLMKLKHAVITSVDRDDLPDGGASIWAKTIIEVKKACPDITIEVLIPDFNYKTSSLDKIIAAQPTIVSHNLETVRRLTPLIRSKARYDSSLQVLKYLSDAGCRTKSGIMLGLGETENEVEECMDDLLAIGCRIMTIGQYLQPAKDNLPVSEYISPAQFEKLKNTGIKKGFRFIESSPLVRSSYLAEKHIY
jgi:lipoic acid synthetase